MALEETGRSSMSTCGWTSTSMPSRGASATSRSRRADPTFAEMKVVADGDARNPQPLDQFMVNEILRAGPGAGLVEGHDDGARKAGCGQQAELIGLVGQPELGGVGAEVAPRVRLESDRQRRPPMRPAHFQRRGDDGPMPEMNPVEIAHRHHRSLRDRGGRRRIADNGKNSSHFNEVSSGEALGSMVPPDRDLGVRGKSSRAVRPAFRCGLPRRDPGQLTGCLMADASP